MLGPTHLQALAMHTHQYMKDAMPSPSGWIIDFNTLGYITVTSTVLIIPTLGHYLIQKRRRQAKMQMERMTAPFAFMDLPAELRIKVYENLLEDPCYPPPQPCSKHHDSPLSWMLPENWSRPASTTSSSSSPAKLHSHAPKHQSNWLFVANKQVYAEYMDLVCKKKTFRLTVSPQNYTAPDAIEAPSTTTTTVVTTEQTLQPSSTSPPSPPVTSSPQKSIWNISPTVLKSLRKCDIKLITTSPMLGVTDPRDMQPQDWALAHQIRHELREVSDVGELNLHVKAIGDPLWNPLWVWFHASQSLKSMGTTPSTTPTPTPTATDREGRADASIHEHDHAVGPKLNRITFSLDTWSPGENYLERDAQNGDRWAWRCLQGHCTGVDGGADVTVREFCAALYAECATCRPDLEDGDEEEGHDS